MRILFVLAAALVAAACAAAAQEGDPAVFESAEVARPANQIDQLVFAQLNRLNVRPVICSDAVFVRRVYLDLLGTLPTAQEARDFIQDTDRDKRRLLIERLLMRNEYADYWAMKWGDVLRIKAEFPVNLWPNAAQAYHRWLRASLAENKPYDRFVREMLTASGSNFRVGPVNFYRATQSRTPEGIARVVALTFMGARTERWPSNRIAGLAAFFSYLGYKPTGEWKEEHVYWDSLGARGVPDSIAPGRASVAAIGARTNTVNSPTNTSPTIAPTVGIFPDGQPAELSPDRDPREQFADWLIRPENPWFTRCIVNRVWAWLVGRGIIHEPDDIREDNPPSNAALLAFLEKEMIAAHYDLKQLCRLILNSQTYQLSAMAHSTSAESQANFASYPVRRLDAEVLSDAINKVAGTSDLYTSPIPEPFTYIPKGVPAVAIADGSISSPFLALFGRSARATGMENERNNNPTPAQWLYLLNSTEIQRKLEQGTNLQAVIGFGSRKPAEIVDLLYLTILSRFPTPAEIKVIEGYGRSSSPKPTIAGKTASTNSPPTNISAAITGSNKPSEVSRSGPLGGLGPRSKSTATPAVAKRREDWLDLAWALINSEEFLYHH